MTRYGVLITFNPGVTREQAEKAVERLADVADIKSWDGKSLVERYDDRDGGPVWYIP